MAGSNLQVLLLAVALLLLLDRPLAFELSSVDVLAGLNRQSSPCKGSIAECSSSQDDEFLVSSHQLRRLLQQQQQQYISYGSLSADKTPCPAGSGRSYYTNNCNKATGNSNPTQRSCTTITRCARDTS